MARELVRRSRKSGSPSLAIRLLNSAAADFNRALYRSDEFAGIVEVVDERTPDSLIRLPKRQGEVDIGATLERWRGYPAARQAYLEAVRPLLAGADLVIHVGVPLLVHAAERLRIQTPGDAHGSQLGGHLAAEFLPSGSTFTG